MKTFSVLALAFLALSMVAAFPLIGEAFAQTTDSTAPTTESLEITGPNTVIIKFSEPVIAPRGAFENFTVTGGTFDDEIAVDDREDNVRLVRNASGSGTDTITLTVSGTALPTDATGTIDISAGVRDLAANEFSAVDDERVADGQAPMIKSAMITDTNSGTPPRSTVTLTFSETISAVSENNFSDFTLTGGTGITSGTSRNILTATANDSPATTVVLTISGAPLPTDATATIDMEPTFNNATPPVATGLHDAAFNAVGKLDDYEVTAGQIPTVESAKITGPNTVTITFSETDMVANVDNFTDFTLTGGTGITSGTSRNVTNVASGGTTDIFVLTISGASLPTDATATIDMVPTFNNATPPVATGLHDAAFNAAVARNDHPVTDGQAPTLITDRDEDGTADRPAITAPNTVTITFSEAVNTKASNFTSFTVTGESTARTLSSISGSGTDTIVLAVSGDPMPTNATGTINIGEEITDLADNDIAAAHTNQAVLVGQLPQLISAKITGPYQVTIVFSQEIAATGNPYIFTVRGESSPRDISSVAGTGTASDPVIVTLTSSPPNPIPRNATGTLDILSTDTANVAANNVRIEKVQGYTVEANQIPTVESAKITSPNIITITFSENVATDASNFTDFTLTGGTGITPGDTREITGGTSAAATTLELTIQGTSLPTDATGTIDIKPGTNGSGEVVYVRDTDEVRITPLNDHPVTDGQAPTLITDRDGDETPDSPAITAPNTVTITFSEAVNAKVGDFVNFVTGTTQRNVTGISGSGTDTIMLTVSGTPIERTATGTIRMVSSTSDDPAPGTDTRIPTSLVDNSGNYLSGDRTAAVDVHAGQIPTVVSAEITTPNTVTVTFSIPVNALLGDFTDFTVDTENTARTLSGIGGSGTDTIILTVSGDPMPADATGTIDISSSITGTISSAPINEAINQPVAAGQAPTVVSAKITAPNTVTITFSETVVAAQGHFSFTVSGESDARTSTGVIGSNTEIVDLTVSGDPMPADATGTIDISSEVAHGSTSVKLKPVKDHEVTDGQSPTVKSANITDNNTITIMFSEAVNAKLGDFTNFILTGGTGVTGDESRTLSAIRGSGTDTITLTVSGASIARDAVGRIDIANTVIDLVGNALKASQASLDDHPVAAGQIPTIESTVITGPNTVTITFSEPVTATVGDFTDFRIMYTPTGGSATTESRNITGVTGSGTETIMLTISGGAMPLAAEATVDISDGVTDLANNAFEAVDDHEVDADAAPTLNSAMITGPRTVTIKFSEPITTVLNDYTDFKVRVDRDSTPQPRNIIGITGSNTDTITLSIAGTPMPVGTTGTIDIDTSVYNAPVPPATARTAASLVDNRGQQPVWDHDNNDATDDEYAAFDDYQVTDGQVTDAPATDTTPPTLSNVTLMSSNTDSSFAAQGDTVTLRFTASEPITVTAVTILGTGSSANNLPDGNIWEAQRVIQRADIGIAAVSFTIDFEDLNGNAGTRVSATTDGSSVSLAACPLGEELHPHDNTCAVLLENTVTIGLLQYTATDWQAQSEENNLAYEKAVIDFNDYLDSQDANWMLATDARNYTSSAQALTQVEAFKADGIDVIVGVPTSAGLTHIKDFIDSNDMTVISCCSTAPSLAVDDSIFRTTPDDSRQAPLLAAHITKSDIDSIVIIYRNDAWGQDLQMALSTEYSGTVLDSIAYTPADSYNFESVIEDATAALGTNSGIVFLGWSEMATIMEQASGTQLDDTVWFGSGDSANDQDILDSTAAADFAERNNFSAISFTEQTNETSMAVKDYINSELQRDPSVYAYTSYDALYLAGLAIDSAQSTMGPAVAAQVPTVAADRVGAVGPNTLNDAGDLASANYFIWKVEDGMWVNAGSTDGSLTITGTVFIDTNGNGMQDRGEVGYADYTMYAIDVDYPGIIRNTTTDANGMYSFDNVRPAPATTLVQSGFFPAGHTVLDDQTSWYSYVEPTAENPSALDLGFYPVPPDELTELTVTVYNDANRNGMHDAGESGIKGLDIVIHTHTIGPQQMFTDNAGMIMASPVPADFLVYILDMSGYAPTGYNYERTDSTTGKMYNADDLLADDPAPRSTHTMMIGLTPTS